MALEWSPGDRAEIDAVLGDHPVDSNRCVQAARGLLPIARRRDREARSRVLRSDGLVLPRSGPPWFHHHVATLTRGHDIDAFTGPPGREDHLYLQEFWQYPEALEWQEIDIMREEPR